MAFSGLVPARGLFRLQAVCFFSIRCSFSTGAETKVRRKSSRNDLWVDLFSYPSQWWDNRAEKPNPRFPDFKHKKSGEALWLNDGGKPPWVESKIATISPGLSIFSVTESLCKYNKAGNFEKTLELFEQLQKEGINVTGHIYMRVLYACASLQRLEEGKRIHQQMIETGCKMGLHESTSLVDMYAKCGSIEDAWRVFRKMPTRDVVGWTAMILGVMKCGQGRRALELFENMQQEGVEPDSVTFVAVLNVCASTGELEEGKRVHRHVIRSGCECDEYVGNALVDMYAKCGSIDDAWRVFNKMPKHDVVGWNAMIKGLVKSGESRRALELFVKMQQEGVEPNSVTFVAIVNACSSTADLEDGKRVHRHIMRSGCEWDEYLGSSLVDMFAKCGSVDDAWMVFNKISKRDVVCWNAMILGFVKCGQGERALKLFEKMQQEGVEPDAVTFVAVLNACASTEELEEGKRVHKHVIRSGCESDVVNALVDMYAKCGSVDNAWKVFNKMPTRNVVGWNAMIQGFVKCGQGLKALELFQRMEQEQVEPDAVTFVAVFNACASRADLEEGKRVHRLVIRSGCECDVYVGSSLVDMYAKCGCIDDAWRVFDKMPKRNVVGWTSMILGFVKCGQGLKALELFENMQREQVEPDSVTFLGALNACASVAALETGKRIHRQIIAAGREFDQYVVTSLVDMYAKCGSLKEAERLFSMVPTRSVSLWNAMIMGYAIHGYAKQAVDHFEQMFRASSEINEVTFICVLTACSHGGLVKEGVHYFDTMKSVFGISPRLEHYTCMVDLLARSGHLEEAEEMAKTMPFEPSSAMWMAILGACKIHGNVAVGERASKRVLELDSANSSGYVLLSHIYAAAGDYQGKAVEPGT